jgi:hypothetical protein
MTVKKFTIVLGEDGKHTLFFKVEGDAVIVDEDENTFNAFYTQIYANVFIMGEGLNLEGTYDGELFNLNEIEER